MFTKEGKKNNEKLLGANLKQSCWTHSKSRHSNHLTINCKTLRHYEKENN